MADDRNNTLLFDMSHTFDVDCAGIWVREDKPGALREGNVVRIYGVRGIYRIVSTFRDRGKLVIEVEKIHGEALFWVRDIRTNNAYPVEAVCSPRVNDPAPHKGTELFIRSLGYWIPAATVVECQDPSANEAVATRPRALTKATAVKEMALV